MKQAERWELIYDQINGALRSDDWKGIKNETGKEGVLRVLVEEVYSARDRLCRRTGISPDRDPDLEAMVSGFERLCRCCGALMYQYGWKDGNSRSG